MKFILIAAALNLQVIYPTEDVCRTALKEVLPQDPKAICIPKGEDKSEDMFNQFFKMVDKLQAEEKKRAITKTETINQ
jgi:hypothetical protein